ncbi:hypothetical protein L3X39_10060 [Sabulilitoribacter multivorans]|uniref:DUF4251 domain-containing protein n=1 Tax=Flaviramulus multivorans TaxID=1304750 RepID=A0ABS9IK65_9FLAO|nr:hypothetical protein [Flaviramulus multivorans]MCF7560979.1 hypothetical protein [Flaviramulus multivorans]
MNARVKTFLLAISFFVFTNCSKDGVEEPARNEYGVLEARIDGIQRILPAIYGAPFNGIDDIILIYGYNDDSEIGISMQVPPAIGTYNFSEDAYSATLTFGDPFDFFDQNNDGPTVDYFSVEGYVTITKIDGERVVGVFEFTAEQDYLGQRSVEEGKFDVLRQKN